MDEEDPCMLIKSRGLGYRLQLETIDYNRGRQKTTIYRHEIDGHLMCYSQSTTAGLLFLFFNFHDWSY